MQNLKLVFIVIIGVVLNSCAAVHSINLKESQIHYNAARKYESKGDYNSAREQYWKALVAANSAKANPITISMLTYEFGRATGYACHLSESRTFLLKSLDMEEKLPRRNSRNIGIRLFEIARLMYDSNDYIKAVEYYSKALPIVEEKNGVNSDPIAFAGIYEEYADALKKVGKEDEAQKSLSTAKKLRESNSGRTALFVPTRYKCNKNLDEQK